MLVFKKLDITYGNTSLSAFFLKKIPNVVEHETTRNLIRLIFFLPNLGPIF
jgi:hypothetical protein